ncbi:VanZ family protein [Filimonas zeae]|uniref:VanZ-like domain-containing protein n=1 Tax=Filimonas zeae TaxID=1737353 RepID=A0A917J1U7_9BACT|nr:VanZ family protein [Filimonas zeae]MDR6341081.1 VanZ family protein [Filimonas zeae]GGH77304.1 hypothetical protein GCM10011379_43450 [Filimonas zeae]
MKKTSWLHIPALIFLVLSIYLLTIPGKDLPEVGLFDAIPLFDKWVHMGMFGILVFLFAMAFQKKIQTKPSILPLIALLALAYGIAMEYVQKYCVANRSFDITDILADGAGCAIGWWLAKVVLKRKHSVKQQII